MNSLNTKDGFGYDLDEAMHKGNIFERVFHSNRIFYWLNKIDYSEKKVLDIGCNTGIMLLPLLKKGVDIVGVDISKKDIVRAKKKLHRAGFSATKARVADAKKLPFKAATFDIVLLSDILEHADNPKLVAKEAVRVLKSRGFIYVSVPNEWHPVIKYEWLRKLLSGRDSVDEHPDEPYNKEKLLNLFSGVGVIEINYAGMWTQVFAELKKL
jgi:ubiquinone/menaquinone biosynthesis C-methylase UbiE